jgi:hypothetical protein
MEGITCPDILSKLHFIDIFTPHTCLLGNLEEETPSIDGSF